jgi:large conductance mechanosensitive channel
MGMMKEFKDFAMKGNVIDLAVGIVIGGAFGAIVNSLVGDVIMPLIGIVLNGVDFKALMISVGNAKVTYGNFIQAIVNFLIIAFALFLVIKAINATKKKEEAVPAAPAGPSNEEKLLMEIRDLLKK